MADMTQQLEENEELQAAYAAAHLSYIEQRNTLGEVAEIAGISAGGMPTRVKCLHAVVGHSLAAGRGVNPMGDAALDMMEERGLWSASTCTC